MASNTKADQLANVQLFATCTSRELAQIALAIDERAAAAGEVVVRQGDEGTALFLIVSGLAEVTRDGQAVVTLGPGEYFGELALLDGSPRSASVTASSGLSLLVLGQREFVAVIDEWPGVARKLLIQLATRLRDAEQETVTH
jgi:CRP/FNR family transcriptional regulator, cyclic AMP receptor protein